MDTSGVFGGDVIKGARIEIFGKDDVIIGWIKNLWIKIKMKEKRETIDLNFKKTGVNLKNFDIDTDRGKAVTDAISIAKRRQEIFWCSFGSVDFTDTLRMSYVDPRTALQEEIKLRTVGKSEEHLKTFKPLNEWLSRGFCDDGVATGGQRLRYVCELVQAETPIAIKNEVPTSR